MYEVVEYIIENKIVETLVRDYKVENEFKDDLIQETYLILLNYDQNKLKQLIENKHIKFYIARIIKNQYFSKSCEFFRKFKRPLLLKETLQPILDNEEGEPDEED